MRKICRKVFVCFAIACFFWLGGALADKEKLKEELIRIHVVANSDSPEDQSRKYSVRDAVLNSLKSDLENISDADMARSYLEEKLPYIQRIAGQTLEAMGCEDRVRITLQKEAFERSENALYAFPAGIYQTLRITIGSGQGRNWWSVLFSNDGLIDKTDAGSLPVFLIEQEKSNKSAELEIRFWFLDALGKVENIFFRG